jgi:hypothetical protein
MISSRTTVKSIERAVSGVRAAGIEVGRVIVHAGGVVEIVAADSAASVTLTTPETITCDDVFNKRALRS